MSDYRITINDEPGNVLGPYTELGSAASEADAKTLARKLAAERNVTAASGVVVMVSADGSVPKWGCTTDEPDLAGGWTPTLRLDTGRRA